MRWHVAHGTVGRGHLYQGRFKSFPVQEDEHFLTVCRYVERNALSARVVRRAEDWRWGSLWARRSGTPVLQSLLSDWPVERPADWLRLVNQPMTEKEARGPADVGCRDRPYGDEDWQQKQVKRLGLLHTCGAKGVRQRLRGSGGRKTSCVPVSTADGKGARGPADVGCPGASLWG